MCEKEKVKCPSCGHEWDEIDSTWPSSTIEYRGITVTDYFCKNEDCGKILYGYRKVMYAM